MVGWPKALSLGRRGVWTLKIDMATQPFLGLTDMRQGCILNLTGRQGCFLNLTGRQGCFLNLTERHEVFLNLTGRRYPFL